MNEEDLKIVPNLYEAPSNPALGDTYYNINEDKYYGYDGSQWIEVLPSENIQMNFILKKNIKGINLLEINQTETFTFGGITATYNGDGSVTLNGTCTRERGITVPLWVAESSEAFFERYPIGNLYRFHIFGYKNIAGMFCEGLLGQAGSFGYFEDSSVYLTDINGIPTASGTGRIRASDYDKMGLYIKQDTTFDNTVVWPYLTEGSAFYEKWSAYGEQIDDSWYEMTEYENYEDFEEACQDVGSFQDVELHYGTLSQPENLFVIAKRGVENTVDSFAKIQISSFAKEGFYSYSPIAVIYPKIIFNKHLIENLVNNTQSQSKSYFNNILVFLSKGLYWELSYTDVNGNSFSQKYNDYNELLTHLHSLETELDTVSIIEGSEYKW